MYFSEYGFFNSMIIIATITTKKAINSAKIVKNVCFDIDLMVSDNINAVYFM